MKQINTYLIEKFKINKKTIKKNLDKEKIHEKVFNFCDSFFRKYNVSSSVWQMYKVDNYKCLTNSIDDTWYIGIDIDKSIRFSHIDIDDFMDSLNKEIGDNVEKISEGELSNRFYIKIYFYSPE